LFYLYPKLLADITQTNFLAYAKLETQRMINKKFTPINENDMYLNIKMSWRLNPKQLNSLKLLAIWRFQEAKNRDLPIGFVAKDHTLMALAQNNPISVSVMQSLEGVEAIDIRHKGKAMLAVLMNAKNVEENDYPEKILRLDEYPSYKQTFKKVKAFLEVISERNGLAIENVASKKQINQYLTWQFALDGKGDNENKVELLSDWRNELFGQDLIDFSSQGYK
jgi:ribonuclease D